MKIIQGIKTSVCLLALVLPLCASAEIKILIGVDPADDVGKENVTAVMSAMPTFTAAQGGKAVTTQSINLTDVIRATRTTENDVIIGPPHIIASAISHRYTGLARSELDDDFVLVASPAIKKIDDIVGHRLYLTQQDSMRSYLAKGMLRENNINLKAIKQITYGKTSGAGLFALANNMTDMTIASEQEAQVWLKENPAKGHIIKASRKLPAGMAVAVRNDTPESVRANLLKWLNSSSLRSSAAGKFRPITDDDIAQYHYIATLGILTPALLPGVTVVSADDVNRLAAKGVTVVDTRTAKEYQLAHVKGAIHAPYVEHSLKDRDFDATQDDFSAIAALPKDKPVIFLCNGPECWKSYKASKMGLQLGIKQIYWFRGGMPEWQEKSLPTATASAG